MGGDLRTQRCRNSIGHAPGEDEPARLDGQPSPRELVGGQRQGLGRVAQHRRAGGRVGDLSIHLDQAGLER